MLASHPDYIPCMSSPVCLRCLESAKATDTRIHPLHPSDGTGILVEKRSAEMPFGTFYPMEGRNGSRTTQLCESTTITAAGSDSVCIGEIPKKGWGIGTFMDLECCVALRVANTLEGICRGERSGAVTRSFTHASFRVFCFTLRRWLRPILCIRNRCRLSVNPCWESDWIERNCVPRERIATLWSKHSLDLESP